MQLYKAQTFVLLRHRSNHSLSRTIPRSNDLLLDTIHTYLNLQGPF